MTTSNISPFLAGPQPEPTPAPPVKDVLNQELAAMRTINVVLSRLDIGVRRRVLSWADSRSYTMQQVPTPTMPIHTVEDIRPNVVDDPHDATADYQWPHVSVYLGAAEPIIIHSDTHTVDGARTIAAELLSAAHRVENHPTTGDTPWR